MHRISRLSALSALALAGSSLAAFPAVAQASSAHAARASTLYVAPAGAKGLTGACASAKYHDINTAIKAASPGDTVHACPGSYAGSSTFPAGPLTISQKVLVNKAITLVGQHARLDASGLDNGITIVASGATVEGFRVVRAMGEGILAVRVAKVTIANNRVLHNDQGTASSSWIECKAQGPVPGDCGEGIHLMTVANAKVLDNRVMYNSGGILSSDEFGPTHGNLIHANIVEDNESDCGITTVGHNGNAVNSKGVPQPTKGGVYDNTISDNVVISNGTTGFGGGILFASGANGGGSYDNIVTGNEIAGNGIGGVNIHQHFPLSDVSGDVISGNWIGTNGLLGDSDAQDLATSGVVVSNGGTGAKITVTVKGNTIAWDHYGIFDKAPGLSQSGNVFQNVDVKVKS
jgi:hypothetical protein